MSETRIVSFVLRFVQQSDSDVEASAALPVASAEQRRNPGRLATGWHGVIRHVQSREEVRFTDVNEALTFIDRYVALQEAKKVAAGGDT